MSKQEFLSALQKGLSGLPQTDIDERISFYGEMIDDRMEEGLSEEDAVREIGNADEIIAQIVADTPLSKLVKEKMKPRRRWRTWEIILLAVGSPLWLSLLISVFAIVVSLYLSVWAVVISLWAVFGSLAVSGAAGVISGVGFLFSSNGGIYTGIAVIGAGMVSGGLSILMFYLCRLTTRGVLLLTKKVLIGIKNLFIGKEDAK